MCKSVTAFDIPNERSKLRFIIDLLLGFITNKPFVVRKYFSIKLKNEIAVIIQREKIDLVHFDMLPLAQYSKEITGIPYVLNNHNVESLLLKRRAENSNSFFEKVFFDNQAKRLHYFEINACVNAEETYVCSQTDLDILQRMAPLSKLTVIENGVDTNYFSVHNNTHPEKDLVFVGGMGWFPNKDGILFFINEVLPKIITKLPSIKLVLVGKSDGVDIPKSFQENIYTTGFVDDFRPIVANAKVYILPIRVGSGTRLKLLEAMSMGKAIVSTSIGAEGVELTQDKSIMYADDAETFANTIFELIGNDKKAEKIGNAARKIAEEIYDWDIIVRKLLNSYEEILPS
jgi:glycosyltransferase involved in cell wall biosynthesis